MSLFVKSRVAAAALLAFALAACSGEPSITNTEVTPSTFAISGLADTQTFTVTTDVRDLSSPVTSVVARVEGTDISIDLSKAEDIAGGERWSATTNITLFRSISTGTHKISITATPEDGDVVTKSDAATVTVTD